MDLRALVQEALNNSLENDFDPRKTPDVDFLANDLCGCCADFEDFDPQELIPFIQEWLSSHPAL